MRYWTSSELLYIKMKNNSNLERISCSIRNYFVALSIRNYFVSDETETE